MPRVSDATERPWPSRQRPPKPTISPRLTIIQAYLLLDTATVATLGRGVEVAAETFDVAPLLLSAAAAASYSAASAAAPPSVPPSPPPSPPAGAGSGGGGGVGGGIAAAAAAVAPLRKFSAAVAPLDAPGGGGGLGGGRGGGARGARPEVLHVVLSGRVRVQRLSGGAAEVDLAEGDAFFLGSDERLRRLLGGAAPVPGGGGDALHAVVHAVVCSSSASLLRLNLSAVASGAWSKEIAVFVAPQLATTGSSDCI